MKSVKCTKCGFVYFATAAECKRCGNSAASSVARESAPAFGGQARQDGSVYYKPSGEVTLAGLALGLAAGLVAGAALGLVYSYIICIIPFVYFNFICTIAYAFGLASAVGYPMRAGKMRNPAVSCFVGMAAGLVSYYFSWAVWLSFMASGKGFSVSALELAARPDALWALLLLVNEQGAWGIGYGRVGGLTVSGIALWVVWAVEALIVLGGAPFGAWLLLTMDPFCEPCQVWCAEENDVISVRPAEPGEIKRRFEAKDFDFLRALGARQDGDAEWFRLDLHRCSHCGETITLRVLQQKVRGHRNGKPDIDSKPVLEKLLLTDNDINDLLSIGSELRRPQPVPAV